MNKIVTRPICVHPDNPHYFLYKGDPTILITSAEHYGAVVNRRFDYQKYLQVLHFYGLNYTRIYPGALIEYVGKYLPGNTLGVESEDLCLPWARSSTGGYVNGGNLFDLDRWDDAFFSRLKDFIIKAADWGVIVEICFFNAHVDDSWVISPLYWRNNIQEIGHCRYFEVQTLREAALVSKQEAYVRKIVEEVNQFDNVILEICDEPTIHETPEYEALEWVEHMANVITSTESLLPKKHLVAQQVEGSVDLSDNPKVQVITAQYVWVARCQQMGGMQALDRKYALNKPIELNETNYFPVWYYGDTVAASRVEAWEFILGGGSGFNHLNGIFTVDDPEGNTADNIKLLSSIRNLKEFIYSFDFISMRQDKEFIKSGIPESAFCRGMSQTGKQYALYLHHSKYLPDKWGNKECYVVTPGSYIDKLVLDIPAGDYKAEWVDPSLGTVVSTEMIRHKGGERVFTTPTYTIDIALGIKVEQH